MTSTPPGATRHQTAVKHDGGSTLTIIGRCRPVAIQPQLKHPGAGTGASTPATFITAFGEQIDLNPEYLERVGKSVRGDTPDNLYNVQYKTMAPPLSLGAFAYKHYEACMTFDALRYAGISLAFESMLDIGSGFAAMPRTAWVRNYARDVTALDLFPYGESALTNRRTRQLLTLVALAERLRLRKLSGPFGKWDSIVAKENFALPPLRSTGKFDYLVTNVFDLAGSHDWINSSLTLTHFDHRELFPKVRDLLTDGGIFTFTVECWWYPINSTQIAGMAPYLCQRLGLEDLIRYFETHQPDVDTKKIADVYNYYRDPSHPTASDYIATAIKNDLHPIFVHRHMNTRSYSKRAAVPPAHLLRDIGDGAQNALRDIHKFKPDVLLEDLYTSHYLLGFRKVSP